MPSSLGIGLARVPPRSVNHAALAEEEAHQRHRGSDLRDSEPVTGARPEKEERVPTQDQRGNKPEGTDGAAEVAMPIQEGHQVEEPKEGQNWCMAPQRDE